MILESQKKHIGIHLDRERKKIEEQQANNKDNKIEDQTNEEKKKKKKKDPLGAKNIGKDFEE